MFDQDDQEISEILETGLEAVLSGSATVEQVLAQHPEQAAILRSEFESALWLVSQRDQVSPRAGFVRASRTRVIQQIKAESRGSGAKHAFLGMIWPRRAVYQWVAALLILVVIFSGTNGVVSAAYNTLPGDTLYPVKTLTEQVVYSLTFSEARRVALNAQYTEERLNEVTALMQAGKYQAVTETLQSFDQQVSQSTRVLETGQQLQGHQKKTTAENLEKQLNQHSQQLAKLENSAPGNLKSAFQQAQQHTLLNAGQAAKVAKDTVDPEATETPVPTATESDTPTPVITETPEPSKTAKVKDQGPDDRATADSLKSNAAEKEIKPTHTPKPTNENRPVKPEQPDPKPPKPSKDAPPPKPEKPTKSTSKSK